MKNIIKIFYFFAFLIFFGCDFPLSVENEEHNFTAKVMLKNSSNYDGTFYLRDNANSIYFGDSANGVSVVAGDSTVVSYSWSSEIRGNYYQGIYLICKRSNSSSYYSSSKFWVKADTITSVNVTSVIVVSIKVSPEYFGE